MTIYGRNQAHLLSSPGSEHPTPNKKSPLISKADSYVGTVRSGEHMFVPGGAFLHWENVQSDDAIFLQYCFIDASNFRIVSNHSVHFRMLTELSFQGEGPT